MNIGYWQSTGIPQVSTTWWPHESLAPSKNLIWQEDCSREYGTLTKYWDTVGKHHLMAAWKSSTQQEWNMALAFERLSPIERGQETYYSTPRPAWRFTQWHECIQCNKGILFMLQQWLDAKWRHGLCSQFTPVLVRQALSPPRRVHGNNATELFSNHSIQTCQIVVLSTQKAKRTSTVFPTNSGTTLTKQVSDE